MFYKSSWAAIIFLFAAVFFAYPQQGGDESNRINAEELENTRNEPEDEAEKPVKEDKTPKGPQIDVFTEISAEQIEKGVPFALTVMVNHPNPIEVRVQPPDFETNFTIERVRAGIQLLKNNDGITERWTSVEFLLNPLVAGSIRIGAFEVAISGKTASTRQFNLSIGEEKAVATGRLQWIGKDIYSQAPHTIVMGSSAQASLKLFSQGKNTIELKSLPLRIEAPENAIIEELPITKADMNAGIYFRINIVPLDQKDVRIAAFTFRFEGRTLSVPGLIIKVEPVNTQTASALPAELQNGSDETETLDLVPKEVLGTAAFKINPFPNYTTANFPLVSENVNKYIRTAKTLWQESKFAESVAELRKGERDLLAGSQLTPYRRDLDNSLNLVDEPDEIWRPYFFWIFSGIASTLFFVIIMLGFVLQRLNLKQLKNKQQKNLVKFVPSKTIILIFCLFFVITSAIFIFIKPENGKNAVLRATYASIVPELSNETDIFFNEGQKVLVRTQAENWVYVETEMGKAGWVPTDSVIYY